MQDEQFIQRFVKGDEDAMKQLHDLYANAVYSFVFQMLQNKEDTEEVLQDSFFKLYKESANYKAQKASIKTFLFTIARNLAISRLRAKNARAQSSHHDVYADHFQTDHSLSDDSEKQVTRLAIQDALRRLSPEENTLLKASFYSGQSHQELSETYQLPLGTLKSKLRRALSKMRKYLEEDL